MTKKEKRETYYKELKTDLGRLNWKRILRNAIEGRRSSWGPDPIVYEWRNAADEVFSAVVRELAEQGYVKTMAQEIREFDKQYKEFLEKQNAKTMQTSEGESEVGDSAS